MAYFVFYKGKKYDFLQKLKMVLLLVPVHLWK